MQIAMTFTNESLLAALFKQWLQPRDARFGPVHHGVELLQVGLFAQQRTNLLEILPHWRNDRFGTVQRMVGSHLGNAHVEACDLRRKCIDMTVSQFTATLHFGHQLGLREFTHFKQVFDRFAAAVDFRLLDTAGNGQDLEVEVWCHALIQAQLLLTVMLAGGQVGKVEKTEVHRFLHLVSVGASQDDPRDMGLDNPEAIDRMRVQGRILQRGDQCLAHGHSFLDSLAERVDDFAIQFTQSESDPLWPSRGALQTAKRPSSW